MKASVIIPLLYGEPQLPQTLERLQPLREQLDLEVLVVVDVPDPAREAASRTALQPLLAEKGLRAVFRVGERGFGSALRRGFSEATGDILVPFMGDACDDPHDLPRLVAAIEGGYDVVAGSRYMKGGGIVGNTGKQRLSRFYSVLIRLAGGPPIHDVSNAFKAYHRRVLDAVETTADSFDVSVELTLKAHRAGFRVGEIPTVWTNRAAGHSSFFLGREMRNYGRWLRYAFARRRPALTRPSAARTRGSA